jgi:hypothetical protein
LPTFREPGHKDQKPSSVQRGNADGNHQNEETGIEADGQEVQMQRFTELEWENVSFLGFYWHLLTV